MAGTVIRVKRGGWRRHLDYRAKGVFLPLFGVGAPFFVSFFGRAKKESKRKTAVLELATMLEVYLVGRSLP